jgi:hypothetical protein
LKQADRLRYGSGLLQKGEHTIDNPPPPKKTFRMKFGKKQLNGNYGAIEGVRHSNIIK